MVNTQIHNCIMSTNINQTFQILQMSIQHLFQAKKKILCETYWFSDIFTPKIRRPTHVLTCLEDL